MSKFTEDLYDVDGNKVKTVEWVAIDDTKAADYPESLIFDVEEAEAAAYVEKDVRYLERLWETARQNNINETRALEVGRRKLGDVRYAVAFDAWETKHLG